MVVKISISIADYVDEQIHRQMSLRGKNNKSEFVEEMIRIGLLELQKQEGDTQ